MSEPKNIKIITFVGLTGTGKTSATQYLADCGFPKVHFDTIDSVVEQIDGVINAGQHRVVLDGLDSWDSYKALKHEYPGELTTVAVTTTRHMRHHRLTKRIENPMTERDADQMDYNEIETQNAGGVIAIADYFMSNNGSLEKFHTKIDDLLHLIDF